MKFRLLLTLLATLSSGAFGMSSQPKVAIRFYTETNKLDGETTSRPVHLEYARRDVQVSRIAAFSESNIRTILPYPLSDGTWGCVIQLDTQGTMRLDSLSNEARGSALVVFVATKQGVHQVVDLTIDRNVTDGVVTIPRGLTPGEIAVMRHQFKVIEPVKPEVAANGKKPAPKPSGPREWAEKPPVGGVMPTIVTPGVAPVKKPVGKTAPSPDLPRVAD